MFGFGKALKSIFDQGPKPARSGFGLSGMASGFAKPSSGGFTGMGRGLSGLSRGTYDFGGGFRNDDPVASAQSVGRRPKRLATDLFSRFNDRDLRTAPRPDAPMLTRQVPEEYQELVDYQDPDYFNYVRNTPDLRKAFEATPEAKELAKAAWNDQTGAIDTDKFDGDAYRDAAIKFGEDHYTNTGKGEGRELPMIDRQRYETKERMVDELYEGERPDREKLFDTARNAIQDRLYSNMGRQREFNPYNFDSYSPSRRGMGRGPLNMGLDSMFGGMFRNSPYGQFPGFGGGMQPFNPYGGGFGRRGMFGGMFGGSPYNTSFSDDGMSGGIFGGIGRGLGGMFGRPGMGGAMDPFMTPRGGRGMFGAMNDIARRGMQPNRQGAGGPRVPAMRQGQSGGGDLPSGYSYEAPAGMAYSMDMPKNGGRWAYGPSGDRIEVGGTQPKPVGGRGLMGMSFLRNLFG